MREVAAETMLVEFGSCISLRTVRLPACLAAAFFNEHVAPFGERIYPGRVAVVRMPVVPRILTACSNPGNNGDSDEAPDERDVLLTAPSAVAEAGIISRCGEVYE